PMRMIVMTDHPIVVTAPIPHVVAEVRMAGPQNEARRSPRPYGRTRTIPFVVHPLAVYPVHRIIVVVVRRIERTRVPGAAVVDGLVVQVVVAIVLGVTPRRLVVVVAGAADVDRNIGNADADTDGDTRVCGRRRDNCGATQEERC